LKKSWYHTHMSMISNPTRDFYANLFIFRDKSILLENDKLPSPQAFSRCISLQVASDWFSEAQYDYSALLLEKDAPNPSGLTDIPLRQFFAEMKEVDSTLSALAARAMGLLSFRKNKRFCSICAAGLEDDKNFTARTCPRCGHQFFPQLEPAIIVLVSRNTDQGEEILLARHKNRSDGMYSCIAGFVEMGETIEHAVEREIKEETNLTVKNIRYVASQAWPFPDQLMLAFRAEYESGQIQIQEEELMEAAFFNRKSLPKVPPPGSVAHNLIHGCFDK